MTAVVLNVFTADMRDVVRRPALTAALRAWKRPTARQTVAGLSVGDAVAVQLSPDVWRAGVVEAWETHPPLPGSILPSVQMARVSIERLKPTDPAFVRRTRTNLHPITKERAR